MTYCGWGGAMPSGYELVLRERRAGPLELWRKGPPLKGAHVLERLAAQR